MMFWAYFTWNWLQQGVSFRIVGQPLVAPLQAERCDVKNWSRWRGSLSNFSILVGTAVIQTIIWKEIKIIKKHATLTMYYTVYNYII